MKIAKSCCNAAIILLFTTLLLLKYTDTIDNIFGEPKEQKLPSQMPELVKESMISKQSSKTKTQEKVAKSKHNIVRSLWSNDTECKGLMVRFGRNLKLTFLSSYPRSGNTWTRYLLEAATGIWTGVVHKKQNKVLDKMGFEGGNEYYKNGRVLVVKTHNAVTENKRAIILIRKPLDSIISVWSYYKTGTSFHKNLDEEKYKTEDFHLFFRRALVDWERRMKISLSKGNNHVHNHLIVFYEKLVENPIREVKRMLNFLNFKEDQQRIACLMKHIQGPAKRDHGKIDPYTRAEKLAANSAIKRINKLLSLSGIQMPKYYMEL